MKQQIQLWKAASWLLRELQQAPFPQITRIDKTVVNEEAYPWVELGTIKASSFSRKLLRDAADLLYGREEIVL